VKGTPSWVHFGDGKDVFDSQLTPGKHKLALPLIPEALAQGVEDNQEWTANHGAWAVDEAQ